MLAQVTNPRYPGKAAEAKLKKLAAYGDPDTVLLLICPASEVAREDSILVVPLDLLFDEFVASEKGQRWLAGMLEGISDPERGPQRPAAQSDSPAAG